MKFTIKELVTAEQALNKILLANLKDVKTNYRVGRILTKTIAELRDYSKSRMELVEKHAEKDDKGKTKFEGRNRQFTIPDNNIDAWQADNEALLSEEVEIDFSPLPLSWLEGANLNPADMINLDKFIIDDVDEKKI